MIFNFNFFVYLITFSHVTCPNIYEQNGTLGDFIPPLKNGVVILDSGFKQ